MSTRRTQHDRHRAERIGTIDAAGRFSLGRVDRALGPDLRLAAATATRSRLVIRFLDTPDIPEGWVSVPVIRAMGRYPHLRLTGSGIRRELEAVGLAFPVRVHIRTSVESRQIILWRVR